MYRIIVVIMQLLVFSTASSGFAQECPTGTGLQPYTPSERFVDNENGTVTDTLTGLMWQKCALGQTGEQCSGTAAIFTWSQALQQAASSYFLRYGDWRLPNVKELLSIVEVQCYDPAINLELFPNAPSSRFWTSTPRGEEGYTGHSFTVNFLYGETEERDRNGHPNGSELAHVLLVRAGQQR